jgi:hypothetical protein
MLKMTARLCCGLALLLVSVANVSAQDAVLAEFYGSGVHQYFAGNTPQAVADLTAAIRGGTKDPRAYYFRALAELQMGQQKEATADLQKGAELESTDLNQFYPVGKSLERVQGSARLTIERYRAVARAQAHDRQRKRDAVRYEQRRRAEAAVLRTPQPAPPAAAEKASAAEPVPPTPAAEEDPFAEDKGTPAPPEPDSAEPAAEAADSPFEADADKPAEEMKDEAAADKPAADEADPFADEK